MVGGDRHRSKRRALNQSRPMTTPQTLSARWRALALGQPRTLVPWLTLSGAEPRAAMGSCALAIIAGVGLYGAAMGMWRSPMMSLYVAIKLPLIIFITLAVNGMLNAMLAQVLGSGLSARQTLQAILMSFAVFAMIVGALSPAVAFLTMQLPSPESADASVAHRAMLLAHTSLIAFAGIVATVQLFALLKEFAGGFAPAMRTLIAWLAGNLFVGAQIGYLMRPVFGDPGKEVQFLRDDPFAGSFYEAVWWAFRSSLENFL